MSIPSVLGLCRDSDDVDADFWTRPPTVTSLLQTCSGVSFFQYGPAVPDDEEETAVDVEALAAVPNGFQGAAPLL